MRTVRRPQASGLRLAAACAGIAGLTAFNLGFGLLYDTRPRGFLLSDVGLAVCFAVPGAVAWRLRPRSRTGLWMLLLGLVILVETPYGLVLPEDTPGYNMIMVIGEPVYWLQFAIAGQLLLSYPTGRLTGRVERLLVLTAYGLAAVACATLLVVRANGSGHAAFDRVSNVFMVLWIGLAVAAATVLVRRLTRARPRQRRQYRFAVATAAAALVAFVIGFAALVQLGSVGNEQAKAFVFAVMAWTIVAALPLTFFVGLLRERLAFAAVGGTMSELTRVSATRVEAVLGEVLRDPGLRVGFPSAGGLRDVRGRPFEAPGDGSLAITPVGDPPVAVLGHDPALADDPELLSAAAGAARLALDNARLYALLRSQLDEVSQSRRRLAEAADGERRRLERELRDGARQTLETIEDRLAALRGRLEDPDDGALVAELTEELRRAIGDLRDIARGLRPAVLTEHGLPAALAALGRRARIPVVLDVRLTGRYDPVVEATAYYVVSEALQNVVKHTTGCGATVRARQAAGHVVVEVADSGPGGADDRRGGGLQGLRDRVHAVGGRFTVESTPEGTRVRAELPGRAAITDIHEPVGAYP
ncbi:ATP-binding protein [Actinoplanes sp. NPDC024001]|uniref:sensor histidine kinase n=1 Tax=Actinoplanes sp. NPDC024001 TaxID=3154598 RepID=UPI0033F8BE0F